MTLRDVGRLVDPCPWKNDRELLAAVTTGDVLSPSAREDTRRPFEHFVPERMSVGVIEVLEPIQIGEDQGDLCSMPEGSREFTLESFIEMGTVPETGQSIELGSLGKHPQESLSSEGGTNTCSKLGHVEGFSDEVDGTEIETSDPVHRLGAGGHEDDREITGVRICLQTSQDLESVEIVEIDVEEDHVGLQLSGGLDPGFGVVHGMKIYPLVPQTRT